MEEPIETTVPGHELREVECHLPVSPVHPTAQHIRRIRCWVHLRPLSAVELPNLTCHDAPGILGRFLAVYAIACLLALLYDPQVLERRAQLYGLTLDP